MSFYDFLNDGFWRRQVAVAWIENNDPETLVRGRLDSTHGAHGPVRDLLPLLAPLCALQVYGDPDSMEARAEEAGSTFELFRASFDDVSPAFQEALGGLAASEYKLRGVAARLRDAVAALEADGWTYDAEEGRAKRMNAGNRPYGLRRKLVVALASDLEPNGKLPRNTAATRQRIVDALAEFVDDVSAEKDGPVDNDLRNEKRKRGH